MTFTTVFPPLLGFIFGMLVMALFALAQWDAGYRAGHHDGHRKGRRRAEARQAERDAWKVRR